MTIGKTEADDRVIIGKTLREWNVRGLTAIMMLYCIISILLNASWGKAKFTKFSKQPVGLDGTLSFDENLAPFFQIKACCVV